MAERNKVATKAFDSTENPSAVVFKFAHDGAVFTAKGEDIDPNFATLSTIGKLYFLHGMRQKYGDEYAGEKPEAAMDLVTAMHERAVSGEWNEARQGGGGTAPSLVLQAVIAALKDKGKDDAFIAENMDKLTAKYVGKGSKDARDNALTDKTVKSHYDRIQKERREAREAKEAAKTASLTNTVSADDLI